MEDRTRNEEWLERHQTAMAELGRIPGVVRVGYGLKETDGEVRPVWAYRVYVERKLPLEDVAAEVRIPKEIGGTRTDVQVGWAGDLREDSTSPTLNPGDKITRYIPNSVQESGTLGLLVRKGTDRFILTNQHVLDDDAQVNDFSKDVYSPHRKTSAQIECNNPGAQLIPDQGVKRNFAFEGRSYYVDAALATIYAGIGGANTVADIGALDQGLFDLATLAGSGSATPVVVRKRGATTDLTQGTVVEFFHSEGTETVWNFQIRPDLAHSHAYSDDFTLAPGVDVPALLSLFAGKTVTATTSPSAEGTVLHLSGRVFSRSGDSGSCVVDAQRRIVGLHYAAMTTYEVEVKVDGRVVREKLPLGNGAAAYIRPVFSAMGLSESAGVIPPGSPSAGAVVQVPAVATGPVWRAPEAEALADLETLLEQSEEGRRLLTVAERHYEQLSRLVHHRRRVMVAWHRARGPAFVAALLEACRNGDGTLPREIDGVRLVDTVARMRSVLIMEGDDDLRRAIDEHGERIAWLATRASSIAELKAALLFSSAETVAAEKLGEPA